MDISLFEKDFEQVIGEINPTDSSAKTYKKWNPLHMTLGQQRS